eukprot:Hpha_TRINITY_DN14949_c3_g3::TRINITY_DN14949_c3_g3_i9::g.144256::m.144256
MVDTRVGKGDSVRVHHFIAVDVLVEGSVGEKRKRESSPGASVPEPPTPSAAATPSAAESSTPITPTGGAERGGGQRTLASFSFCSPRTPTTPEPAELDRRCQVCVSASIAKPEWYEKLRKQDKTMIDGTSTASDSNFRRIYDA